LGQTTDQIEAQIAQSREDLSGNFRELENKVRAATNWRHYYQEHTVAFLAAAVGVGALASLLCRRRK
jgi:predicted  nucleic acid-binding Zn ribbon protein